MNYINEIKSALNNIDKINKEVFEVKLNEENLNMKIMINNKKYIIFFNSLMGEYQLFSFGTFVDYFYIIHNKMKNSNATTSRLILTSNLCFDHRIPPHELSIKNDIDLISNDEEIEKMACKLLNGNIITTYHCKTINDLFSASLYHFISRGFYLRNCLECGKWFVTKGKNNYCSLMCEKKSKEHRKEKKSQKEILRQKQPVQRELLRIRAMLKRRDNGTRKELSEFNNRYNVVKNKLDNKQLLKWLQDEHVKLKIKKG